MVMNNNDNVIDCNVLYMSPYYLKNMPKENKKSYIIAQRNRSYFESDYMILKEFTNELSKYNNEFVEKHLRFLTLVVTLTLISLIMTLFTRDSFLTFWRNSFTF